jgi:hypothetical protein
VGVRRGSDWQEIDGGMGAYFSFTLWCIQYAFEISGFARDWQPHTFFFVGMDVGKVKKQSCKACIY